MKKLAFGALLAGLLVAACGGDSGPHVVVPDAAGSASTCNPLTQAGCGATEKCTWIADLIMEGQDPIGHIGCAPAGTVPLDGTCMRVGDPGATGYDDCGKGAVCSSLLTVTGTGGFCKALCDQQGGMPTCDGDHVCVTYSGLFTTGDMTPNSAGVCDHACDPFADNDFDGSGTVSTRSGTTCGSSASVGCYGYPSQGTVPATGWSCTNDYNFFSSQPVGLRHRVECTATPIVGSDGKTRKCLSSGGLPYTNSCNQGYLPLLQESTMITTAVCIAMCKPVDCYMGNCGTNNVNTIGVAPHRCNAIDAVGTFQQPTTDASWGGALNGEHCEYEWRREIDNMGNYLPSPTSNTVGFCFDHSKYMYDSDGDNVVDKTLPPCSILPTGFGSGSGPSDPNYWGAADLGCESTSSAGIMAALGKVVKVPASTVHKTADLPRPLYHRVMGTP